MSIVSPGRDITLNMLYRPSFGLIHLSGKYPLWNTSAIPSTKVNINIPTSTKVCEASTCLCRCREFLCALVGLPFCVTWLWVFEVCLWNCFVLSILHVAKCHNGTTEILGLVTLLGHSSDLAHGSQASDSSPLSIGNVTLPHLLLFIKFGAIPQTHNLLLKSIPFIEYFLDFPFSGQLAFIRHRWLC